MKRYILIIVFAILGANISCSQNTNSNPKSQPTDKWELFATENIWTFLKLDTSTGIIYQLQFSINDSSNRGEVIINSTPLVTNEEITNGRFTLYPTQNMYNFILLDQINGSTYQVQWSTDEEYRGLIPIKIQ